MRLRRSGFAASALPTGSASSSRDYPARSRGTIRQDRSNRDVRTRRPRQPRPAFRRDQHPAAAKRPLSPSGHYGRPTFDLETFRKRSMNQKVVTRFIFPGGELDHVGMTIANLERHGFEVHDVEGWREHYLKTLEHWISRLEANREQAERQSAYQGAALAALFLAVRAWLRAWHLRIFQTLALKQAAVGSCVPPTLADLHA